MKAIPLILALVASASAVMAGDWQTLKGDELRAALEGRRLIYDTGAWQDFNASGRTLYNAGRDSRGYWRITGDRYCSQWPPSDLWSCYDVRTDGAAIRFVTNSGETTGATYAR